MIFYALDVQKPGNMLIIAGDSDFPTLVKKLRYQGFNVMVCHLRHSATRLVNADRYSFEWYNLLETNYDADV